ncbi:MAG: SIS domain-containing protein [Lentisphaeria bacterium]|nr:SIS domain-containing protein [Lentisphaeria bacterium]
MNDKSKKHLDGLFQRLPELSFLADKINLLTEKIIELYKRDGVLFLAGNGGSCCDGEHIAGELLKGFRKRRPLTEEEKARYASAFAEKGAYIASQLQKGLRAVSLNSHPGLCTAFGNDVDGVLTYAQQLYALGRKGDILIGISTGGGAANIEAAFITAKANGITTVLLTGSRHGICEDYADIIIDVPQKETYLIQEYHIAIYHALCAAVEEAFFDI